MKTDGSNRQRLIVADDLGGVFGFASDGHSVCFSESTMLRCVDLQSGVMASFEGEPWTFDYGLSGDWRATSPTFVGAFFDSAKSEVRLAVADGPAASRRVIGVVRAGSPRWRPGSDDLLYRLGNSLVVTSGLNTTGRVLAPRLPVTRAEWAPTGEVILYIGIESPGLQTAGTLDSLALRQMRPDGSADERVFPKSPEQPLAGLADIIAFEMAR